MLSGKPGVPARLLLLLLLLLRTILPKTNHGNTSRPESVCFETPSGPGSTRRGNMGPKTRFIRTGR
jgi:hypothetical protein